MDTKIVIYLYTILINGIACRNVRIIGGEVTDIRKYPFVASIRLDKTNNHVCAGTIISHEHILTAAHCLYNKDIYYKHLRIHTGSSTLSGLSKSVFTVEAIHIHPGFQEDIETVGDFHNDIAVITIYQFIKFNEFQNKIDLPKHDIVLGSFATIIGWGFYSLHSTEFSDHLLEATVKSLSYSECSKYFSFLLRDDHICTYNYDVGTSMGDSGGPMIINGELVGIVSFSIDDQVERPDVQNNVYTHRHFIRSVLDDNF